MKDYKNMYFILLRAINEAIAVLQRAQRETEKIYMSQDRK